MTRANSLEVTDEFWHRVEPLVPLRQRPPDRTYVRQSGAGRKPKGARLVFEAIVYVLRTGCQWKALPVECFGSASAIHARFMQWEKTGFFEALWQSGLAEYDDLQGIAREWQSIDGSMVKAPLAQQSVGAYPTDRGKKMEASATCWSTGVVSRSCSLRHGPIGMTSRNSKPCSTDAKSRIKAKAPAPGGRCQGSCRKKFDAQAASFSG